MSVHDRLRKLRDLRPEDDWGDKFYAALEALEEATGHIVTAHGRPPHQVMADRVEDAARHNADLAEARATLSDLLDAIDGWTGPFVSRRTKMGRAYFLARAFLTCRRCGRTHPADWEPEPPAIILRDTLDDRERLAAAIADSDLFPHSTWLDNETRPGWRNVADAIIAALREQP